MASFPQSGVAYLAAGKLRSLSKRYFSCDLRDYVLFDEPQICLVRTVSPRCGASISVTLVTTVLRTQCAGWPPRLPPVISGLPPRCPKCPYLLAPYDSLCSLGVECGTFVPLLSGGRRVTLLGLAAEATGWALQRSRCFGMDMGKKRRMVFFPGGPRTAKNYTPFYLDHDMVVAHLEACHGTLVLHYFPEGRILVFVCAMAVAIALCFQMSRLKRKSVFSNCNIYPADCLSTGSTVDVQVVADYNIMRVNRKGARALKRGDAMMRGSSYPRNFAIASSLSTHRAGRAGRVKPGGMYLAAFSLDSLHEHERRMRVAHARVLRSVFLGPFAIRPYLGGNDPAPVPIPLIRAIAFSPFLTTLFDLSTFFLPTEGR